MTHYDAIIIGSGQGGTPLAKKIANKGLKTAIIEKRFLGGTCINDGCTPTKTLIASARIMHLAQHSKEFGITIKEAQLNFKKVMDRKNKMVEDFRNGAEKGLKETQNLDVILGEASFIKDKELLVAFQDGGREIFTADKIFINAGARPAIPKIDGLDKVDFLNSTSIMDLKELPEHLVIIGGGYISLEFGQMFRRFGSKVTILEHSEKLLSKEDDDAGDEVKNFLEKEGIKIFTGLTIDKVKSNNKEITVTAKTKGEKKEFTGTHLLVAAGRTPNTDVLQLHNTNIKTDEHYHIMVNEKLETNVPGIYALGDIKGGPEFTHISYNDHLIIYKNLFEKGKESTKERMVPFTMFTDPQFGRVGLNEKQAQKENMTFKVAKLPMSYAARALETNETTGFMKALIDPASKKILGATVIGEQGGEIMSMLQLAMMGNITYDVLRSGVFAHPLYAESLNNLFMQLDKDKQ